jgi:tetraacyldisaccharide 4'-kinase
MRNITLLQTALAPLLKPLSWGYGCVMRVREWLFKAGIKPSWKPKVVTVSVGNIGWGGTGKTPISGWLLGWATGNQTASLLLTRGYKAKPVKYPYVVLPGALPEEAGDEPLMLATENPRANIVVDPVRKRAGKWAVGKFNPGLIILDDGFQHMAVQRHCNLVLLKPEDLGSQWEKIIPAGSWREPKTALKRADAFLIKLGPQNFERILPIYRQLLGHLRKPIFSFQVVPTGLKQVIGGNRTNDFEGERYMLVTGVGDPKLVQRTAIQFIGYKPTKHMIYKDHHAYTKTDVTTMLAVAKAHDCHAILCTPKDAVKLGPLCTNLFWQFDLRVDFGPSSIGDDITFASWWPRHYDRLRDCVAGHGPQSHFGDKDG